MSQFQRLSCWWKHVPFIINIYICLINNHGCIVLNKFKRGEKNFLKSELLRKKSNNEAMFPVTFDWKEILCAQFFYLEIKKGRTSLLGAFNSWMDKFNETRIFGFLQAALHAILHNGDEFVFAELAILYNSIIISVPRKHSLLNVKTWTTMK